MENDTFRKSEGEGREKERECEERRICDIYGYCGGADCPDFDECKVYGFRLTESQGYVVL